MPILSDRYIALKARADALRPEAVPAVAFDILRKAAGWGDMTDRQAAFVDSLLRQAELPVAKSEPLLNLSKINQMFDRASAQLKRPFVMFLVEGQEFRISPAPATGRNPGCLYIKQAGQYQGKITADGGFASSRDTAPGVWNALKTFAADPAKAAHAYGQSTGSCCFCARELTDARSVIVGYGPICADRYGLPWGEVAIEEEPSEAPGFDSPREEPIGAGEFDPGADYDDELAFRETSGFEVE